MQLQLLASITLLAGAVVATPILDSRSAADVTLSNLAAIARQNQATSLDEAYTSKKSCTRNNISIRKEWGKLSKKERIAYTDAVLCFQAKSPLTPTSLVPGVRSRYDDYVATHINQTLTIHYTGTFLAWHRYYLWTYEQALRSECGYTGVQPYWDWAQYSNNTTANPIFDGSATSMSGNGAYIANREDLVLSLPGYPDVNLTAGTGGGCVTSGPFKNMSVNLGPVALPLNGGGYQVGSGLDYNPRCLVRDIGSAINNAFAKASDIASLLTQNPDIYWFQTVMQGVPGSGNLGVHGGGHYTIAGNPGGDTFASPGDPAFYLHHGMVDRIWWMWQMQDPANRMNAVSGTGTFLDLPPSANTTLDTVIDLGYAANTGYGPKVVGDLTSITAGPFCYTYDSL